MLSKRARTALGRLKPAAIGSNYLLSVNGHGEWFTGNGRKITHKGIHDLIDAGVLVPVGDALLPGMTQTYRFDPQAAA